MVENTISSRGGIYMTTRYLDLVIKGYEMRKVLDSHKPAVKDGTIAFMNWIQELQALDNMIQGYLEEAKKELDIMLTDRR